MKFIIVVLIAGCASVPPARPPDEVCYTAAEHAALARAYGAARQYGEDADEEIRRAHKFRQSIEGLKGYCS